MRAFQSGVTHRQADSSEGKDTYRPAHYGASAVGVFCCTRGRYSEGAAGVEPGSNSSRIEVELKSNKV